MPPVTVGVSLKTYFDHGRAQRWFAAVADRVREHPAVRDGEVNLVVVPTYLQLHDAVTAFSGTPVRIGAQDVSAYGPGAYTGEVTAAELAEIGVRVAEIGHAERRRLFGETDRDVAAKAAAAIGSGLTPLLCVGEADRLEAGDAQAQVGAQLDAALHGVPPGPVIIAYEPVWAIGASEPAPIDHIGAVCRRLRADLHARPDRPGSVVIYGGSAGPGLLAGLHDAVDGLFLGRLAHDPDALLAVVTEAAALASDRAPQH